MSHQRQQTGNQGEYLAARFLEKNGFVVIETNYHFSRNAEIDIIAMDQGELVFVEVKTRHGHSAGYPEDAVTPAKLDKMKLAAQNYLLQHPQNSERFRFDVVAIQYGLEDAPEFKHFKAVC